MFKKVKKSLNKEELECLHYLLTKKYNRKPFKPTDYDDVRYLRMKVKEVLDNLK
jgi:hypothetical protein